VLDHSDKSVLIEVSLSLNKLSEFSLCMISIGRIKLKSNWGLGVVTWVTVDILLD